MRFLIFILGIFFTFNGMAAEVSNLKCETPVDHPGYQGSELKITKEGSTFHLIATVSNVTVLDLYFERCESPAEDKTLFSCSNQDSYDPTLYSVLVENEKAVKYSWKSYDSRNHPASYQINVFGTDESKGVDWEKVKKYRSALTFSNCQ